MKRLLEACDAQHVLLEVHADDMPAVTTRVMQLLMQGGVLTAEDAPAVAEALERRERLNSSAIGHALAVPHAYLDCLREPVVVIVRLAHARNMGAPDGIPTRFLFYLLGPPAATSDHLDTLASIARLMSDDEFRYQARGVGSAAELRQAIADFGLRTGAEADAYRTRQTAEPLEFTGRPLGGLVADVRRRLPHYVSDFTDGLQPRVFAAVFALFFACLAPAVTFGGIMASVTGDQIGVTEMLVACAVGGVFYALTAGQPLIILGSVGPTLVFTSLLYGLCGSLEIPFLPTYACVGIWASAWLFLAAATDASALMRFFTRFTDEIFAALISLIFIYDAVRKLFEQFQGLEASARHDTALLTLLLALGTFYLAMSLSALRQSRYLLPWAREMIADFGPTIAIVAMALVAMWLHGVDLDSMQAPDTLGTTTGRVWLVSPLQAPTWVWLAAAVPALFLAILLFLTHNITARLINSPDHNLHKGSAYHADLGIVAVLTAVTSLFGLPWLVAATVRSLNHVRGLATTEQIIRGDGRHTHVLRVVENRLSGLLIHVLMACSLFLIPLLKKVPMAVLFGLFLYMGVVSLRGNQFWGRLQLLWTDPELYPPTHYVRRVPRRPLHTFTAIQLACLAVLAVVQFSGPVGILFPLFIALLVPVRMGIDRFFTDEQLQALDADELPEEEEQQWA